MKPGLIETHLEGRTVLVTGAAGGIGSSVARECARLGSKVVIHFNSSTESAKALEAELRASFGKNAAIAIGADLCDELAVAQLWKKAESTLGPIQHLVANAGWYDSVDRPIQELELSQWKTTLDRNLTSVFLSAREFFRGIVRHGITDPSCVLVGSTAGQFGEALHSDYAAAKAAIAGGFLLSLKNEIVKIAPQGRINAVCPGWTLTPMAEKFTANPDPIHRHLRTVPLRKIARPHDVARQVITLLSPLLSGHVTGQAVLIAGGMEGRTLWEPSELSTW